MTHHTQAHPRILFIPVSGPEGIGEYMRSLVLADALKARLPDIEVEFILSGQAPYVADCPYPVHITPASPTKSTAEVIRIIRQRKPTVAVFDCSGRAQQYRAAKACGAKVVFISQHKKKRKRAFALNRIKNIDWHAIVQFECVDGGLNRVERLKLALFRKPAPDFIGAVFASPAPALALDVTTPFALFAAGGGGHKIDGELATDIVWEAARQWHQWSGQRCYVILGPNYPAEKQPEAGVIPIKQLPNSQLVYLLSHCALAVIGGGDMMAQAVTLGVPVVALPVAKDQPPRIQAFVAEQLVVEAMPTPAAILGAIEHAKVPNTGGLQNGADRFVSKISEWLLNQKPA